MIARVGETVEVVLPAKTEYKDFRPCLGDLFRISVLLLYATSSSRMSGKHGGVCDCVLI